MPTSPEIARQKQAQVRQERDALKTHDIGTLSDTEISQENVAVQAEHGPESGFVAFQPYRLPQAETDEYGQPTPNQEAQWAQAAGTQRIYEGFEDVDGRKSPIYKVKQAGQKTPEMMYRERVASNQRMDESRERQDAVREKQLAVRRYTAKKFVDNYLGQGLGGIKLDVGIGDDKSGITEEILNDPRLMSHRFLKEYTKQESSAFADEESGRRSSFSKQSLDKWKIARDEFTSQVKGIVFKRQGELYENRKIAQEEFAIDQQERTLENQRQALIDKGERRLVAQQKAAMAASKAELERRTNLTKDLQKAADGFTMARLVQEGAGASHARARQMAQHLPPDQRQTFIDTAIMNMENQSTPAGTMLERLRTSSAGARAGSISATVSAKIGPLVQEAQQANLSQEETLKMVEDATGLNRENPAFWTRYRAAVNKPSKTKESNLMAARRYSEQQQARMQNTIAVEQSELDDLMTVNKQNELITYMMKSAGLPGRSDIFSSMTDSEISGFAMSHMMGSIDDKAQKDLYQNLLDQKGPNEAKAFIDKLVSVLKPIKDGIAKEVRYKEDQYLQRVAADNDLNPKELIVESVGTGKDAPMLTAMNPGGDKAVGTKLREHLSNAGNTGKLDQLKYLLGYDSSANLLGTELLGTKEEVAAKKKQIMNYDFTKTPDLSPQVQTKEGQSQLDKIWMVGGPQDQGIIRDAFAGNYEKAATDKAETTLKYVQKRDYGSLSPETLNVRGREATGGLTSERELARNWNKANFGDKKWLATNIFKAIEDTKPEDIAKTQQTRLKDLRKSKLQPLYGAEILQSESIQKLPIGAKIADKIESHFKSIWFGKTARGMELAYHLAAAAVEKDMMDLVKTNTSELTRLQEVAGRDRLRDMGIRRIVTLPNGQRREEVITNFEDAVAFFGQKVEDRTSDEYNIGNISVMWDIIRDYSESADKLMKDINMSSEYLNQLGSAVVFNNGVSSTDLNEDNVRHKEFQKMKKRHDSIGKLNNVFTPMVGPVEYQTNF